MNGQAGKGDRTCPVNGVKWANGFALAFGLACKHRFKFSYHYRAVSGATASCDQCTKCGTYRFRAGATDPCVNCPEEEMCLYRCKVKIDYVEQQENKR